VQPACSKLTSSNPGQTFYNVFFNGTPGQVATFNLTIPYPYVTQGATPVHAYDGATITVAADGTLCIVPGKEILSSAKLITLANYSPQKLGSTYTVAVNVVVPASGFIYFN